MTRLLLTSGRGPDECRIALAKTLAVLRREADAAGLDLDVVAGNDPDGHGPASAIALVAGEGASAFAASWTGSILWVARSPLRPHHKRKNWFVGVFELGAVAMRAETPDPADVRFANSRPSPTDSTCKGATTCWSAAGRCEPSKGRISRRAESAYRAPASVTASPSRCR